MWVLQQCKNYDEDDEDEDEGEDDQVRRAIEQSSNRAKREMRKRHSVCVCASQEETKSTKRMTKCQKIA